MPHHQGGESSEREEEMHKDQMLIALGNEIDLEQWRARELGALKVYRFATACIRWTALRQVP